LFASYRVEVEPYAVILADRIKVVREAKDISGLQAMPFRLSEHDRPRLGRRPLHPREQ
jgi:hypothetical protein